MGNIPSSISGSLVLVSRTMGWCLPASEPSDSIPKVSAKRVSSRVLWGG